jgi:hypothetical protein
LQSSRCISLPGKIISTIPNHLQAALSSPQLEEIWSPPAEQRNQADEEIYKGDVGILELGFRVSMLGECPVDLAGIIKPMYFRKYAIELGTSGEMR